MKKYLVSIFIALFTFAAFAAEPLDCRGLKFASGQHGKGYSLWFDNIKDVAGNVPLCEINTHGALDNVNALSTNAADVGITTLDVMKDMSSDENIASLQVIIPLNSNFLHFLTNVNGYRFAGEKKYMGLSQAADTVIVIQKFSDLKGRKVALVGSAQLWVRKLNKQLGYNMTFVDVDTDAKGFDMARKGLVQAVATASGWPSGTVKALKSDDVLTLIPYDAPSQSPYVIRNLNYSNIGVYNSASIGVQNVLVTRPFHGSKLNDVAVLRNIIAKNLTDLQDGSYEPGWKEIKSIDAPVDWAKFVPGKK